MNVAERYDRRKPPPFVCQKCQLGLCEECIDVLRVIFSDTLICKCKRKGHDGEPVNWQIKDPETGAVHGPNVVVNESGEVTFPNSITCPKCGMTSHHPEDIKQNYCRNCHQFHDQMEL